MFCRACGMPIEGEGDFCGHCGAKMLAAPSAPVVSSASSAIPVQPTIPSSTVAAPAYGSPASQATASVVVNIGAPSPIIIAPSGGNNILVRAIYFLFVGWWLGGIMSLVAWGLTITVVGLPLGLWMINRLPTIMTLRSQGQSWHLEGNILRQGHTQYSFLVRAIYFVFVGWWLSFLWLGAAYAALLTVLGLPLAFWMYDRIGAVTTLYRS